MAIHHMTDGRGVTACERFSPVLSAVSKDWKDVTCRWCLRKQPKVKVSGVSMSVCRYSIEVNGRRWEGDSIEGFARDIAESEHPLSRAQVSPGKDGGK